MDKRVKYLLVYIVIAIVAVVVAVTTIIKVSSGEPQSREGRFLLRVNSQQEPSLLLVFNQSLILIKPMSRVAPQTCPSLLLSFPRRH